MVTILLIGGGIFMVLALMCLAWLVWALFFASEFIPDAEDLDDLLDGTPCDCNDCIDYDVRHWRRAHE